MGSVSFGATSGLKALELVEGFVESLFQVGLVAGELREGVRPIGVPDEGSAERGGLRVLPGLYLLCLGEGFLVLLFVR